MIPLWSLLEATSSVWALAQASSPTEEYREHCSSSESFEWQFLTQVSGFANLPRLRYVHYILVKAGELAASLSTHLVLYLTEDVCTCINSYIASCSSRKSGSLVRSRAIIACRVSGGASRSIMIGIFPIEYI